MMTQTAHRYIPIIGLALLMWTGTGLAQNAAMTAEDRLSLLYQPRFDYTETGEPIIRVHLKDAEDSIQFTPDQAIKVMPNGEGGPEIRLPGKKPYTVTISEAEAGTCITRVVMPPPTPTTTCSPS